MKIIHTADLHLGQILYQNYDRVDEHQHFFSQLEKLCVEEKPDALVVSGDVFDIQQPSASTKKAFTEYFVAIHTRCPEMKIVITAGNHDSASRIQADSSVWKFANACLIGIAPSMDLLAGPDGWQEDYVVKLDSGYIIALPYMSGDRTELHQSLLDWVGKENKEGKPVVMIGHLAVTGMNPLGHDIEIGKITTQSVESLGSGYDYLALGHIHKPQTIGHKEDALKEDVSYPSGVVRYSGSALPVSCDEKYPHSVSIVEIQSRGGDVRIRQSLIDELRLFYELPLDGSFFTSVEEAIDAIKEFADKYKKGYFRLHFDYATSIPANFNDVVYDLLGTYGDEIRFNPKHDWVNKPKDDEQSSEKLKFEVAELQQMTDPLVFIEKTKDQYPGLDLDDVRKAFEEVKVEVKLLEEEEREKAEKKDSKKSSEEEGDEYDIFDDNEE